MAAARQSDGTWLAVAPRAEPFPNAWQKRVILWFALSLAVVSPLAWLFARRIVHPLRDFAMAAEQLGRDPSATIIPLSGPAEIGRAANAFNQMRNRLRAFVDDRTAMVGAISHDLRTPLTRLRFRIEDVADDQRDGLLKEVGEMEAMISQVIAFIRDASTPGPRQRIDFAELVRGSVADAKLVGADVEIERNAHVPVDVDPVGIRRIMGNLLENAVKYGARARVRVFLENGEAVAEVVDAGPGIPEDEFDRAFEPFYRSDTARKSGQSGSGLGLAVCRSIARAHGGDVSFAHAKDGFLARVTMPAAFTAKLHRAA
ncbi:ATP-binding protein [Novosphingobium malaysiense]|uniref:ATP-binding protein n=1 Tax=Novosphingobium malaysiense TaxID=1348853 RepID=UPI001E40383D|nr:ATP-binding protein [Novosphingobium malaysiense]